MTHSRTPSPLIETVLEPCALEHSSDRRQRGARGGRAGGTGACDRPAVPRGSDRDARRQRARRRDPARHAHPRQRRREGRGRRRARRRAQRRRDRARRRVLRRQQRRVHVERRSTGCGSPSTCRRWANEPQDFEGGWVDRVDLATGEHHGALPGVRRPRGSAARTTSCSTPTAASGSPTSARCGRTTLDRGGALLRAADGSSSCRSARGLLGPNGVGLSPDGDRVYVAESYTGRLIAWDARRARQGRRRRWPRRSSRPRKGHFDSLAVEADGKVVVAAISHGLCVVDPTAAGTSTSTVPDRFTTNVCFTGDDMPDGVRHHVGRRMAGRARLAPPRPAARLLRSCPTSPISSRARADDRRRDPVRESASRTQTWTLGRVRASRARPGPRCLEELRPRRPVPRRRAARQRARVRHVARRRRPDRATCSSASTRPGAARAGPRHPPHRLPADRHRARPPAAARRARPRPRRRPGARRRRRRRTPAALEHHRGAPRARRRVDAGRSSCCSSPRARAARPKAVHLLAGPAGPRWHRAVTAISSSRPTTCMYCAMPLFHSNAHHHVAGRRGSCRGATIALRRRFSASGLLDDVREFGVTYFNYVGKPLAYILATPEQPDDADNPLNVRLRQRGRRARHRALRRALRL